MSKGVVVSSFSILYRLHFMFFSLHFSRTFFYHSLRMRSFETRFFVLSRCGGQTLHSFYPSLPFSSCRSDPFFWRTTRLLFKATDLPFRRWPHLSLFLVVSRISFVHFHMGWLRLMRRDGKSETLSMDVMSEIRNTWEIEIEKLSPQTVHVRSTTNILLLV